MIRKGDTKDANESKGDGKAPEEKWFRGNWPSRITRKAEKLGDRKNGNRSLSLQRPEEGNGAGNIETGGAEIALPTCMEVSCMSKLFYPAVFHRAEEGGFWVTFPDIPECMTQGDDIQQAYEMAVEALGLSLTTMEDAGEEIPKSSMPEDVDVEDGFLMVVEFDMAEYRRKYCSKAVKKTLSIPEWLNEAAMRQNINFSQVLQEALMQKVNM